MPRAAARIEASRRPAVRRTELRSVQSALERLRHGDGGIIEISGDPGSGKTRLLAEAKRAAEELGLATLSGCCAEAEEQTPLSAFAPIVGSRLMAEAMRDPAALPIGPFPLAATAAPQPARPRPNAIPEPFDTRLRARLLLARCARDGLVLLLDDFHWADTCSVDVVEHFIRSPLDAPLLLILAHRPRQSAPRMRAALAHGIEMGTVEHLRLGLLTLHQSAEILDLPADHPQLHRLHRVSTGNPFYLLALADHRTCAAPPTDGASGPPACSPAPAPGDCAARLTADQTPLIIGELASLGAGEIAVLSAGAILGDGFDWATLSTVADLPLDETARAIDRLAGKDLLQHSSCGSRLTLRHPALGTLLREDMTSSWRAGAHRRALRLLVRRGAPAAELADHLEFLLDTIGLDDLDVLERAARDALWSAPNLSIRWAKAALRILREPTDPDRHYLRLTQTLGYALAFSGQLTESSHLFRKIRPLLRTVPARVRLPTVALHAMVESLLDHRAEATTLLAEELAALPPRPPVEAVGLHVVQGLVGLLAGRAPEPAQVQAAVRIAAQHHDWLAEGGTLALRGLAEAMAGEVEVAGQSLSCSAALLDGFSDQRLRDHPEYLALLGRAELFIGRFKAARRHFERGVVLLRSPGTSTCSRSCSSVWRAVACAPVRWSRSARRWTRPRRSACGSAPTGCTAAPWPCGRSSVAGPVLTAAGPRCGSPSRPSRPRRRTPTAGAWRALWCWPAPPAWTAIRSAASARCSTRSAAPNCPSCSPCCARRASSCSRPPPSSPARTPTSGQSRRGPPPPPCRGRPGPPTPSRPRRTARAARATSPVPHSSTRRPPAASVRPS